MIRMSRSFSVLLGGPKQVRKSLILLSMSCNSLCLTRRYLRKKENNLIHNTVDPDDLKDNVDLGLDDFDEGGAMSKILGSGRLSVIS